jgi:hypothetical protein
VDFSYPLGDDSDAKRIVEETSKVITRLGPWPVEEIWAVWQRTNTITAEYMGFKIL